MCLYSHIRGYVNVLEIHTLSHINTEVATKEVVLSSLLKVEN